MSLKIMKKLLKILQQPYSENIEPNTLKCFKIQAKQFNLFLSNLLNYRFGLRKLNFPFVLIF